MTKGSDLLVAALENEGVVAAALMFVDYSENMRVLVKELQSGVPAG